MSQTRSISRNTRSIRMKRAEAQAELPGSVPPAAPGTDARADVVERVKKLVRTKGFDIEGALRSALRRMIEVEIDTRQ